MIRCDDIDAFGQCGDSERLLSLRMIGRLEDERVRGMARSFFVGRLVGVLDTS